MRRWTLIVCALLLSVTLRGAQAAPTGDAQRGLELYGAYCIGCHGLNGQGDGPVAARLRTQYGQTPADLADASFQASHTDEDLVHAIQEGGARVHKSRLMPAWGLTLSPAEVQDIVAYIRQLKGGVPETPMVALQAVLDKGRAVYTVQCLSCHGVQGHGGPLAAHLLHDKRLQQPPPDLGSVDFFYTRSDAAIAKLITGPAHRKIMTLSDWDTRPIGDSDLRAIALYLRTLSLTPPRK